MRSTFGWSMIKSRPWRFCLTLLGAMLLMWLMLSFVVAYVLTHRSRSAFPEPVPTLSWGSFESHRFKTRDGQHIGAWLLRGDEQGTSVLLLHGNGGSRRQCLNIAKILAARKCTCLLISLRAHGDSTGRLNDIGYGARLDVIAAIEFLEHLRPGRPIMIHGTSLGAAAATFASRELGQRVQGYVLECPYQDLKTAVWNRVENALPSLLDRFVYQGLLIVSPWVLPHLEAIAPVRAVAEIPEEVPILILAGGQDRSARPAEAKALYARVQSRARLSIYENAGHLQLHEKEPARYESEILDFVSQVERSFADALKRSARL